MDPVDVAEKVLSVIKCIYSMWQEYKAAGAMAESCYKYIAGVEQALINYKELLKTEKLKGNMVAISNLQVSVTALQDELTKQAKQGNFKKFFTSGDNKSNLETLMRKIEQDVNSLNLDVSVAIGMSQTKSFDEMTLMLSKIYSQVSSNADEESFKKEFISREAADIWVRMFKLEHHQSWNDFIEKFSTYVSSTEKVTVSDSSRQYLREYLDQDHDQTVSIDEWDNFYLRVWSILSEKVNILGFGAGKVKKCALKTFLTLRLSLIDQEVKQYMQSINSEFKFSPNGVTFPDLQGKTIERKKDLSEVSVVVGRDKTDFTPDLYFDRRCSQISNKQFEVFVKATDNQNENGYYAKCISATNPTSFYIQEKGIFLNDQMMINISQVYYLRVDQVFPSPSRGDSDANNLFVDTNDVLQSPSKIGDLKEAVKNGDFKTGVVRARKSALKEPKPSFKLTLLDYETLEEKQTFGPFENSAENSEAIFHIGSEAGCEIRINDPDMVSGYHAQILFKPELKKWIVIERYSNSKQKSFSDNGTFVLFKNFSEVKAKDINRPSRGQRLIKGMKIFFSYNVLEVIEV